MNQTLVEGQRYRLAFIDPRTDAVLIERGTYIGRKEGLLVDEGNAFALDEHDHAYLLVSDGSLVHADLIGELQEVKGPRANGGLSQPAGTAG